MAATNATTTGLPIVNSTELMTGGLHMVLPLAGGGFLGFVTGYALKKIMKLAFIALGLIALLLGYLEYQKWISVNWGIIENQISTLMTHAAHKVAAITQQMGHEIPIGAGVIGFVPGLVIGILKG